MVYIFGNDIPLTILLPFFLIIIMLLFFLVTYIRDNLNKFKFFRFKKKKKKEIRIPINFNKEYSILKRQVSSSTTAESLDAITILIKRYIGEKLNINKQFSFEELPRDKLNWSVIEFTKRLSDLKYSGKDISKSEVNHLLVYLSKIIKAKPVKETKEAPKKLPNFIKLPKIKFKFPKRKHPKIVLKPKKHHKPLDLGLPKNITIDFRGLTKKHIHLPKAPHPTHLKKSLQAVKKQTVKHISKEENKRTKSKLTKFLKKLCREEHKVANLEKRSLKRFLKSSKNLSKTLAKTESVEGHHTVESVRGFFKHVKIEHEVPSIPKPSPIKIKKHKVKHRKPKHSVFERARINRQASKVLRLIKTAERKSHHHPLLARKIYNEALIMYYKLPIDKEENIAIRLNRYYDKVNGKHEKELLQVKHASKKETKEALKHLKKYRNYVIIENNNLNNQLKRSLHEVKQRTVKHINKTKNKKAKSRLSLFLNSISNKEAKLFELEEAAINHLLHQAGSLLKDISREESNEAYDEYKSIKKLFSHLKVDHKLPKIQAPRPKEIIAQLPTVEPQPIKIKPPRIERVIKKKKVEIEPPKLPEKKISARMEKLMEEKKSVYDKLKSVEGTELDRFKQTKRMSTHEDIGYRDYIGSIKPKSELPPGEQRIKKLFDAK